VALPESAYVALLVLLEQPYADVGRNLGAHLRAISIAGRFEPEPSDVSLRDLMLFALRSESAYWYERAVDWLESGAAIDGYIVAVIKARAPDRSLPQGARHRAFTVARRWEESEHADR